MRILHLNTLFPPWQVGGAERTVKALASGMAALNHEVAVLHTVPYADGASAKRQEQLHTYSAPLRNFYWQFDGLKRHSAQRFAWHFLDSNNPWMQARVREVLTEFQPDYVLTHTVQGFSNRVWKTAAGGPHRLIHVLHDQALLCPQTAMFRNGQACQQQCRTCHYLTERKRPYAEHVQAVISVSHALLQKHREHGFFVNLPGDAVHNGYSDAWPEAVPALPYLTACTSDEAQVAPVLTLGYLGRVEPGKGIEFLLQVMQELRTYPLRLLIAGRGDEEYVGHLQEKYGHLNISFMGQVNKVDFFPQLDVLTVPSLLFEGLGNTAIEATVWGRPAIVSDQGGLKELTTETLGKVCRVQGSEAIAQWKSAILHYLDKNVLRHSYQEALAIRNKYQVESVAKAYLRLLPELV
ncbi:MAG: hypothetical protein RLZZ502_1607 [Pseudomonadota bacterium]